MEFLFEDKLIPIVSAGDSEMKTWAISQKW